jgi:predicted permease
MKKSFRHGDARRDVGDELRFHLDMRTQESIDAGMSPDDARRAASAAFGDVAAIDAQLRVARIARSKTRERRDRFHELMMDIAFAMRTLRKNLAFTIASLATLALGIGATTAVFTVVNGVLLRPLPYTDPARLEMIWLSSKSAGLSGDLPLSGGFYSDLRTQNTSFSNVAAFRAWPYTLTSDGDAEAFAGSRVTPSLFAVLGVPPALGRSFVEADAQPGAPHVAMIGFALWQRRFGGSTSIVGQRMQLDGESFTVIGVMPRGFAFPRGAELPSGLQFGPRTEIWTPLAFTPADRANYGTMNLAVVGRLKPGVGPGQARGELTAMIRTFLTANAPTLDLDYRTLDLQQQAGQHVRRALLLLMGAVAFVLFIAFANVTNLLVARTATRRREFAVRAALGAGRVRIARQLVTENVLLGLLGTALGVILSTWATRAMLALVPGSMPRADDVGLDWRVAAAAGALAVAMGAGFGLVSTFQVRLGYLASALHEAGARATTGRARSVGRRVLVVSEVSLSLMLIIGAALLTVSFIRLQRVEQGFSPTGTLTASIVLPLPGAFDPRRDGPGWARFFSQLNGRLSRSAGVQSVGAISALPLTGTVEGGAVAIVGDPPPAAGQAPHTEYAVIEGDYFRTLDIKILAGRAFSSVDAANSLPVVIVNREFARRYLSGRTAIDRQLKTFFDFSNGGPRTIVGVVDNVQASSLDGTPMPQVYVPEQQMPYPGLNFVVRTHGDPMTLLPVIKREIKAIDPRLAVSNVRTMQDVVDASLARQRFSMTIIGVFAGSALLLAMVGLYGVIALSVGQRRREIGVRMALGARSADVLRLVLGEGVLITAAGIVVGLTGAALLSRLLTALLFDVSPTNVGVYAAATAVIVLVTLAASYVPARRAARVDPTSALRAE